MKTAKQLLLSALAVIVVAATSHAGPPLVGVYRSPPNGTDLLVGHHSESWTLPANGFLQIGNAIHAQSWDGATLGTQWSYSCPSIVAAPILLSNTVDGAGNGNKQWLLIYSVGNLTLSGVGTWANGDAVYNGVISSVTITIVEQFASFVRVGANSDISLSGHFVGPGYPCFQFAANGAEEGHTDKAVKPAIFPIFLAAFTCAPTVVWGEWWDQLDITLSILGCTVPNEETTWGVIKQIYE